MLIVQFPREKFVIAVDKIQFVIRCSLSITLKLKTLKFTDNLVVVSIGHRKEFLSFDLKRHLFTLYRGQSTLSTPPQLIQQNYIGVTVVDVSEQ